MKAIQVQEWGGPDVLKLREVPAPQPGAGQAVVRVHAAGVNPVDTYIHTGHYPKKPQLPYTPGSDGAGVIESVGAGAGKKEGCRPGDRVYISGSITGTYAEKALCRIE